MGYFSTITTDAVLASVKEQLRIDTTDNDIYLERLIVEAVRHTDNSQLWGKCEKTLEIEDNKAKLPCGFQRLLGAKTDCTPYIYIDLNFLQDCSCTTNNYNVTPYQGAFEISDGYIFFHVIEGTPAPTEINIAYFGLILDENGLPVIREDWERGIIAYVCWNYCLSYFEQYNQYVIEKYEAVWKAQKRWIKSQAVKQSYDNTKNQVREFWNAWIVSKYLDGR